MYKTIEDIRKSMNINQTQFAEKIGTTFRTYQGRLNGSQPKWLLDEVITAALFNEGQILISTAKGDYVIDISKVK